MSEKTNDDLKAEFTDKKVKVKVDSSLPELARFEDRVGRVVTVNKNDFALVDFGDGPWYDIELKHLVIVGQSDH